MGHTIRTKGENVTLFDIIKHFGTKAATAKSLQVPHQTFGNWTIRNGGKVPHYWHEHLIKNAAKHKLIIDEIT